MDFAVNLHELMNGMEYFGFCTLFRIQVYSQTRLSGHLILAVTLSQQSSQCILLYITHSNSLCL